MRTLSGLREAFGLLTVIPVRPKGMSDPVPWLSWVGLTLGGLAAAIAHVVLQAVPDDLGALLAGAAAIAASAACTGALHLDGLADAADALAAGRTREERLAIMRDSSIGSYGAAALGIVLLLDAVSAALVAAAGRWAVLVWAPVIGRWSATLALASMAPARQDGLAATLAAPRSALAHAVSSAPVLATAAWAAARSPLSVVAGLAASVLAPRWLAKRFGGITGDAVGASIVIAETAALLAGAVAGR